MAVFTDTITMYQKQARSWKRTVVEGVQWSEKVEKSLATGKLTFAKTITVTFPEEVLDQIDLSTFTAEDAIFKGSLDEEVTTEKGNRLSDLLASHPSGGIIRSVNDNSGRDFLKNIKVVVY